MVVRQEIHYLGLAVIKQRHAHRVAQHSRVLGVLTLATDCITRYVATASVRNKHGVHLHCSPFAVLVLIAVRNDARTVGNPQRIGVFEWLGGHIRPERVFGVDLAVTLGGGQISVIPFVDVVREGRQLHRLNVQALHVVGVEPVERLFRILLRAARIEPVGHDRRLVRVVLHHLARRVVHDLGLAEDPAVVVAVLARHQGCQHRLPVGQGGDLLPERFRGFDAEARQVQFLDPGRTNLV